MYPANMDPEDVDSSDAHLFDLLARIKAEVTAESSLVDQLGSARTAISELIDQALATGRIDRRGIDLFCGREVRKARGGARPQNPVRQTPDGSTVMSSADIARMAGVTRATVSNWKTRHAKTFPGPVDDAEPARYRRDDVIFFLSEHGY